jgi:hypothetical protein
MLTVEEARKAGINACVDLIGRDFVVQNKDSATSAYSLNGTKYGSVYCFVGVGEREKRENDGAITLDSTSKFKYQASCSVSLIDGMVAFNEALCVVPKRGN